METYKVRNDKNEEFEVEQSKLLEAEKDGFLPVVTDGKVEHRVSTRDFEKAKADGFTPIKKSDIGTGESAFKGAISGVTGGFSDELHGLGEALASKIGLRGFGTDSITDLRFETDEEDKQSFGDVYEQTRDKRRALEAEARAANPKSYLGGQIAGGVGVSMVPAIGALQAVKGAGIGAKALSGARIGAIEGGIYGAGESEAKDLAGFAGDVAKGVAIGGGAGAVAIPVMAGASAIAGSVGRGAKSVGTGVSTFRRGMAEGATEKPITKGAMFFEPIERLFRSVKKGASESGKTAEVVQEFAVQAKTARRLLLTSATENSSTKKEIIEKINMLDELSDDEVILAALIKRGDNPVKSWIAEKAAIELPGKITKKDYLDILEMSPQARATARAIDPRKQAAELTETLGDVKDVFKKARSERFGELQKEAGAVYDRAETNEVLEAIEQSLNRVEKLKSIPGSVANTIESFKQKIIEGLGVPDEGFTPGLLANADPAEHYLRLQKTRETLDVLIPWGKKEGLSDAVKEFKFIRKSIDKALKTAPGKSQADEMYKLSTAIEDSFFGAVEISKKGNVKLDRFKMQRLLGRTDAAGRFKDAIDEFRVFAQRPDLSEEFREQSASIIYQLDETIKTMGLRGDIESFARKQGPTSPAVEREAGYQRIKTGLGGASPVLEAVISPSGFMNSMDEMIKSVSELVGKPIQEFNPLEKRGLVKLWSWRKKNPNASMAQLEKQTKIFFPSLRKKDAIDEFLK